MRINFIYRSAPGDSKKDVRPDFFEKINCLKSFLLAYKALPQEHKGELIFVNDGKIQSEMLELMKDSGGHLETLPGLGNSASLRFAHKLVKNSGWDSDDVTYFAEDDYLYKKEAFVTLLHAVIDIPEASYFSLYDHPDRYTRDDDVRNGLAKVYISRDLHWRSAESTCQTYGARVTAFKKDSWIHKFGTSLKIPRGREMFRAVQGLGKYIWKLPKHILITPMPSQATHMESEFLAKNVDWEKVNRESSEG